MKDWAELKAQLEELEGGTLSITKREVSLEKLRNMVASHYLTKDMLPQIQPMLATDTGIYPNGETDKMNNKDWAIEPKFNGVRMLMFLEGKVRFQTRGRSQDTQLFTERTGHYPQYFDRYKHEYNGTVLDGEMVAFPHTQNRKRHLWRDNDLPLVMSMNGGRDESGVATQKKKGWARYVAFDILSYKGLNIEDYSTKERRRILEEVCKDLNIDIAPQWIPGKVFNIKERYESVVRFGGEGLILKDRNAPYEKKRSKVWLKIKRFDEEVGFIHALYKMGSKSIEGMAGSVIVNYADGRQLAICGALSHEHRKAMVGPDGNIASEYIGRKVLVRWHTRCKKTNNPHHARIIAWLKDEEGKN